jgi:hypothetical protein
MVYLSVANLARGGHTDPPPIHTPHPFAILARTLEGDWGGKSFFLHFPRPPPQSVSFTLSRTLQEWSEEVTQLAFTSGMSIDNIDVLMSIGADSTTTIANRWDGPDELLAAAAHIGHSLPPRAATRLWTECERRVTIELLRRTRRPAETLPPQGGRLRAVAPLLIDGGTSGRPPLTQARPIGGQGRGGQQLRSRTPARPRDSGRALLTLLPAALPSNTKPTPAEGRALPKLGPKLGGLW